MKINTLQNIALIACFFTAIAATGCGGGNSGKPKSSGTKGGETSTTILATFGTRVNGNCNGKGICSASAQGDQGASPDAIAVTFTSYNNDPSYVVMSFSMNDMRTKQPQDTGYFSGSFGYPYSFDAPYDISTSNSLFSTNIYPPGSILFPLWSSNSPSQPPTRIATVNGILYDTISITQAPPLNTQATFGSFNGNGGYDPKITGIASIGNAGDSMPVTVQLMPGNAMQLVLAFDTTKLRAINPKAMNNFYDSKGKLVSTYTCSGWLPFLNLVTSYGGTLPIPPPSCILPGMQATVGACAACTGLPANSIALTFNYGYSAVMTTVNATPLQSGVAIGAASVGMWNGVTYTMCYGTSMSSMTGVFSPNNTQTNNSNVINNIVPVGPNSLLPGTKYYYYLTTQYNIMNTSLIIPSQTDSFTTLPAPKK